MTLPPTPYKGLMPYSEEDAPFFFGRETEREVITANLMASRLTLLYGGSGVGKSSILRAGVAYHLRQLAQRNLAERGTPESVVVVFSSWRDDPLVALGQRIRESVGLVVNRQTLETVPPSRSLTQTLQLWTERLDSDLLIILDQFEEYFLYHPQEDGAGTFAYEFSRVVNRPDLRVGFLVSIREDALAKLDRFKGRIPNLFDNYLRIEHLDREAARTAIEKPIEQFNQLGDVKGKQFSIEPELVEAVLEQVRTGQVVLSEAGRGVVKVEATEARMETPYLQLVMTRLWNEEVRAGSRVLRLATLKQLGGAEKIVRTHLDVVMKRLPGAQRGVAGSVFPYLVTSSGTKIAHTARDLATYAQIRPKKVEPLLRRLSAGDVRLLRPIDTETSEEGGAKYEIFHDALAPAIIDWQGRYRRRRRRTLLLWLTLSIVIFALSIALLLAIIIAPDSEKLSDSLMDLVVSLVVILVPLSLFALIGFKVGVRWGRAK